MAKTRSKLDQSLSVEQCVGHGTFSDVFRVRNVKSNRMFALKKVYISDIADKKAKDDCINEVHLLQNLSHPNIIKYYCCEFYQHDGTLNVVLELASAGDLAHFIANHVQKESLVCEEIIWKFIMQLSSALDFMHSRRIMHRDLKPANILLSKNENIKIGDFGLGKYFEDESKLYSTSVLGSPYYMSPERLLQMKYYFNSDVWSLGCVIYELAALQSPFYVSKLDITLLIRRVVKCDCPPLPSDVYSKELHDIIDECMTVDCQKRPEAKAILDVANHVYYNFFLSNKQTLNEEIM